MNDKMVKNCISFKEYFKTFSIYLSFDIVIFLKNKYISKWKSRIAMTFKSMNQLSFKLNKVYVIIFQQETETNQ